MKIATRDVQIERKKEKSWQSLPAPLILLVLSLILFSVMLLAVSFGSTPIPLTTIAQILLNGTGFFHFARRWDPSAELIVWQVRMPVVLGAAFVGSALAVAG